MNGRSSSTGATHILSSSMNVLGSLLKYKSGDIAAGTNPDKAGTEISLDISPGGGLRIGAVVQRVNEKTLAAYRDEISAAASKDAQSNAMKAIASGIASADGNSLADMWGMVLSQVDGVTKGFATRDSFLHNFRTMIGRLNQNAELVQDWRSTSDQNIHNDVLSVNRLLSQVKNLNERYASIAGQNNSPALNAVRDERRGALNELRRYLNFDIDSQVFQSTGQVKITLAGTGIPLLDTKVHSLQFTPWPGQLTAGNDGNNITVDVAGVATNISPYVTGGRIHGNLQVRDKIGVEESQRLDAFSREIYKVFNRIINSGATFPPSTTLKATKLFNGDDGIKVQDDIYITELDKEGNYIGRIQVGVASGGGGNINDINALIADINNTGRFNAALVGGPPGALTIKSATAGNRIAIGGNGTVDNNPIREKVKATNLSNFFEMQNILELRNNKKLGDAGIAAAINVPETLTPSTLAFSKVDITQTTVGDRVITENLLHGVGKITATTLFNGGDGITINGDVYITELDVEGNQINRLKVGDNTGGVNHINDINTLIADINRPPFNVQLVGGPPGALTIESRTHDNRVMIEGSGTIDKQPPSMAGAKHFSSFFNTSYHTIINDGSNVVAPGNNSTALALLQQMGDGGTPVRYSDLRGAEEKEATLKQHLVDFLGDLANRSKQSQEGAAQQIATLDATKDQYLKESGVDVNEAYLEASRFLIEQQKMVKLISMIQNSTMRFIDAI